MTDEQRKRVHDITYSTQDRMELAERIVELEDEAERLHERYDEYESKMDGLVRRLTGGLLSKSAATPNDVLYSATMEQMTDELIDENFKLESENAKLRIIVRNWYPHMVKRVGIDALTQWGYMDVLRELGIEVS